MLKRVALLLTLTLSVATLAVPSPVASAPANIPQGCVDFLAFPDNFALGAMFMVSGYGFRALGPPAPFVNVFLDGSGDQVHGAQFSNAGILVKPDALVTSIDIEIGVFAAPNVTIRAFSAAGALLDTQVVPNDNELHNETLTSAGDPIARLRFTGGGNEGVINEICT